MESEQPVTAMFTAIEDCRIVADNGTKCMEFKAGETLAVHRDLFTAAIREGLVPESPLTEEPKSPIPEPITQSLEEIREEGLLDACKTLIMRGNPADFTQLGKPRAASIKKLVDFDFKAKHVEKAFERAMFEVEQYGDDSPEHSEPVSDTAE